MLLENTEEDSRDKEGVDIVSGLQVILYYQGFGAFCPEVIF